MNNIKTASYQIFIILKLRVTTPKQMTFSFMKDRSKFPWAFRLSFIKTILLISDAQPPLHKTPAPDA